MEGLVFYVETPPRVCIVTKRIMFSSYEYKDHNGNSDVISQGNLLGSRILGRDIKEARNRFPEFLYEIELLEVS